MGLVRGTLDADSDAGTGGGTEDEVAVGTGGGVKRAGAGADGRVNFGLRDGSESGTGRRQAEVLVASLGEDRADRADGPIHEAPGLDRATVVDRVEELAGGTFDAGRAAAIPL